MGLDVYVKRFYDLQEQFKTHAELEDWMDAHEDIGCLLLRDNKPALTGHPMMREVPIEYIDCAKTLDSLGLLSCVEDTEPWGVCGSIFQFSRIGDKTQDNPVVVDMAKDGVSYVELTPVVFYHKKEVGYQRKGANGQFYEDGKWDSDTVVVSKDILIDHWKRYFSGPSDYYEDPAAHFKENIVDVFVEGETFVRYA